ncbi:hypothetical protein BTVI_31587 [Pitangus sulphuratus]|nr:hypothetical protein BTVI_31587 [Pitangus sulphuratus]
MHMEQEQLLSPSLAACVHSQKFTKRSQAGSGFSKMRNGELGSGRGIVIYKEVLTVNTIELATIGELLSRCEVALLAKPKEKLAQDTDHALKTWSNAGNCNEPALCYPKSFKRTLNDQVTGDAAGILLSPLFRFGRIIQQARGTSSISRRIIEGRPYAAVCYLKINQMPQWPLQSTDSACREQRDQLLP